MKQILLYLPVIHAGHEGFFARHQDAAEILLLGEGFKQGFKPLAKDIRALKPERAKALLETMLPGKRITVIEPDDLPHVITAQIVVMPDEDITRTLAEQHHVKAEFDRTFLRWDREWSRAQRPANADQVIKASELPAQLEEHAEELAGRSSDWWRQVGAIAWRGGEILGESWNRHAPTEYAPYVDGDPRDNFSRGIRADLSTAAHAEASIVAQAARHGKTLDRADLYVTTFPCPACARLIAEAGFRRCYYAGPYSVLAGDDVLHAAGVELIWVDAS